ncbi:MAG: hypothetical protein RMK52_06385 [Chitinophagales bacterium]|nr:hypothetical protein [Chitinophagales bacterium]MDW8393854.1 hypothetical protein [Chitinophagales bacterium]
MPLFTLRLLLLTGLLALLLAGIGCLTDASHPAFSFGWWALLFFGVITWLTGWMGLRSLKQSARGFVTAVSATVMIKLLASAAFVATYAWITKPDSPVFIIPFFVLYVVFTVFEIREVIAAQKRHASSSGTSQSA